MECKVLLGADKFVGIKDRFMAGEETILAFESSEYALDELHATITDGVIAKRHTVKNKRFDISEYCKKETVLEIKVDLVMSGKVVKTWLLEPLVVRENGGGYVLIPEIALLRKEIRTMKKIIKELNSKINDTM
jgi:hypothetical protein